MAGREHLCGASEARERRLKAKEITSGYAKTSFDKSAFNILEVVDRQVAGLD